MTQSNAPQNHTDRIGWTFLTNHTHVLLLIRNQPTIRVRDFAQQVGVTERSVSRIIGELLAEGFISIEKRGRENHYTVLEHLKLRHPLESQRTVGELLEVLSKGLPVGT